MPPWTMSRTFPGSPVAIAEARRFVTAFLRRWPGVDDAELIVSELATNAVRHSKSGRFGGCFTVSLQVHHDKVWLGVLDEGGPRSPRTIPLQVSEEGGRGLALVAGLAMDWGVTGDARGRVVWAVMDLAPEKTNRR